MKESLQKDGAYYIGEYEFDKADILKAENKAVNKLVKNVTIKGFRKGKAPVDEAKKYINLSALNDEVINNLLHMIDENNRNNEDFKTIANDFILQPKISIDKFSNDGATFKITYFLKPYVLKLAEYVNLKSDVKEAKVEEADIENRLKQLQDENAVLVPSDKEAKEGDTVNIDYVGLLDGTPFDGGTDKGFDLVLGSKKFVPGFEEGCIGHKEGDKFEINLTFPENYPAPMTGKAVVFKVTINSVKVTEIPELNDEFATTLTGKYVSKTLAELKEKVKEVLTEENHSRYMNSLVNDLLLKVRDNSRIIFPDEYLKHRMEEMEKKDIDNVLKQTGMSFSDYLKLANSSLDQYRETLKINLEAELKNGALYDKLISEFNIKPVTSEDIVAKTGLSVEQIRNLYTPVLTGKNMSDVDANNYINNYINSVASEIITKKVQDQLLILNGYLKVEKEEKKEEVKEEDSETTKKTTTKKKTTKKTEEK